ncbi:MAG: TetR family transcriptional regulator [Actinobacteria bacterium]|nr:TetR family transcriptional regulator [Actinomycetota bacterium]MBU1944334.1 TetR family transcriptional regulator [Actinomycetota bacterium]MBU2688319.1 TetR family transcriptional regulator [Actinomycetota bacterium]
MEESAGAPLRISDLEKATGISRNTIHYYLREGILTAPHKTGKTMAYYNEDHLRELVEIKEMREEGFPLSYIRNILERERKGESGERLPIESMGRRAQIMDRAVEVFSRKGYHNTTISDIAKEVGVGHSTFYLYFPSKKTLFMECVDRVIQAMFTGVWEKVEQIEDPLERLRARGEVVLINYPQFIDLLQAMYHTVESDVRLEAKRREVYGIVAATIQQDLEEAVKNRQLPPITAQVWGYFLVGVIETALLLVNLDSEWDPQHLLDVMFELTTKSNWKKVMD